MKIYYHPDTDSVVIHLKDGAEGVVGEIMGEDLNENVVLHHDDAGTPYEMEVEGVPINTSQVTHQESKAG